MTLREQAAARQPTRPGTAIDRLLDEHPDRADEILDLLRGEPMIGARIVAETLNEEFDVDMSLNVVTRWRQKPEHRSAA